MEADPAVRSPENGRTPAARDGHNPLRRAEVAMPITGKCDRIALAVVKTASHEICVATAAD